jgi:DNA-directed RNA polymerase specialized sigma24 family protein
MNHEDLVRLAAGGDIRAFVALMRRFQQAAFGSALAIVHDFDRAEDVVQEAFFAAWAGLPLSPIRRRFPAGYAALFATMRSACCAASR